VAHDGKRDVNDALGEPTLVHDLAGEHKERNSHQRETIGTIDDVLCDNLRIEDAKRMHQRDAANEQRERNGHPESHRTKQGEREYRDCHRRVRFGDALSVALKCFRRSPLL